MRKGQTGIFKHTEEWKKALSERLKGHAVSKETRRKIGIANSINHKGKHFSPRTEFKKGMIAPQKGKKLSKERIEALIKLHTGNKYWVGKKHSPETLEKLRISHLGYEMPNSQKINIGNAHRGEKSWRWIKDRSQLKKSHKRNDPAYLEWRKQVIKRDGKCKMESQNCSGFLMVHHILRWADYPEEGYNVNNGITLCDSHHPRKRVEEKRLMPTFQQLIRSVN